MTSLRLTTTPSRATLTVTTAVLTVAALTAASVPTQLTHAGSAAGAPAIVVEPAELQAVQAPGGSAVHELTVSNHGDATLAWEAVADSQEQPRLPVHPSTPVHPVAQEPGGSGALSDFPGHRGRPGWTVTPDAPPVPPGQLTLTHSRSQALLAGAAVACSRNRGAHTTANGYLRHFTPADYGVVGELGVTAVTFGVESRRGGAAPVTVNLYTLADPAGPFRYDNFELIGTTGTSVGNQSMSLVEVPVTARVPAESTLVVEVAVPDLADGGLYLGAHPDAQSAGSYLRAEACGLPEPAPIDEIGAPAMQLLLNVTGTAELIGCELPGDLPWLTMEPTAGTVAPGAAESVAVTLDSADLADGETRATTLCLASDDPHRPRVEVPVTLRAQAFPAVEVSPGSITLTQRAGERTDHPVTISNLGDADLTWEIAPTSGCDTPETVPWLSAAPETGRTAPGGTSEVTATVDTTGMPDGDHTAALCVASNDPQRSEVAVPVTVTVFGPACDDTVVGVHPGPLTVTQGVTCLAPDAQVQGEVNVLDGAGLVATSAVIQGPLATFGATVVEVNDGMVVGPVSIRGTTGWVTVAGTQVVGSMLVVNNATTSGPLVISGNLLVGSLYCTGNQPPPVDAGRPNNVIGGMKLDQCAAL